MKEAIRAVESTLAKAREHSLDIYGPEAGVMWDNVKDHEGFVLAGRPGACEDQSSQAPTPIPVGNVSYIERFFQKRAEVIRESWRNTSRKSPIMRQQPSQRVAHSGSASRREATIFFGCSGWI